MKIKEEHNPTFRDFIRVLAENGLFRPRSLSTNQLTEARKQDIRPGKYFPIDLSTRPLGDVPLKEVIKSTSVEDLLMLNRVGRGGAIVEIIDYVKESGLAWPIEK